MGIQTTVVNLQKKPSHSSLATLGGDHCPVCDAHVSLCIATGDYHLFRCSVCHSWCSDAFFRDAESSFTYEENYFGHAEEDQKRWHALLGNLEAKGFPMQSILDVGCGSGAFLAYARSNHNIRCAGIEINPAFAHMAEQANPGVPIYTGDAHELIDQIQGSFDLITLWDVFEHLTEPKKLLQALSTKLTDHGSIYIQTINEQSLVPLLGRMSYYMSKGKIRSIVRRTHEPHHLVFYSKKGIKLLAKSAGLVLRECTYDRLSKSRMDGSPLVKTITSTLLAMENAFGNGLFINVLLQKQDE